MSNTPVFTLDRAQKILALGTPVSIGLTSVAGVSGGSTVYTGIITSGGSNGLSGLEFNVYGFQNWQNNGNFPSTASTATTLTLTNTNGVAETFGGTAVSVKGIASTSFAGPTFAVPAHPLGGRYSSFTWSVNYTGSPSGVSVSIQVSNDGVNWETIDTTTATGGETRFVANYPVQFLRLYVTTLSGGTNPAVIGYITLGR